MHNVSANYTLPTLLDSLKAPLSKPVLKARDTTTGATGTTGATRASASSSGNGTSATDLGTTFLSLLSTELQNQDPTAPVDSTAMVGQMISLNQLDQLISINQTLGGATTTAAGSVQAAANNAAPAAANAISSMTQPTSSNQLPFDLNTMMPLAGSALGVALNSGINAALDSAPLGLSGTNTNATGGK